MKRTIKIKPKDLSITASGVVLEGEVAEEVADLLTKRGPYSDEGYPST